MGELGALFNPGMRHEIEERESKANRREEEGNARDGDLRIDLASGIAVINIPTKSGADAKEPAATDPPATDMQTSDSQTSDSQTSDSQASDTQASATLAGAATSPAAATTPRST